MTLEFRFRILRQGVAVLLGVHLVDGYQFLPGVVREFKVFAEPGGQSRVGFDEIVHQFGIAGHDHHQFLPVVFHGFQDRLHGFPAVAVHGVVGQGVGFVDEEHAAQRFLDDFLGLESGLADIAGHEGAPVRFHQLSLGQDADPVVELGHQPGHGGLAGAGVAGKHQMAGDGGNFHAPFFPDPGDLDEVHQAADVLLDAFQPHQFVQLRQQAFQGLFRFRFCGRHVGEGAGGGGVRRFCRFRAVVGGAGILARIRRREVGRE